MAQASCQGTGTGAPYCTNLAEKLKLATVNVVPILRVGCRHVPVRDAGKVTKPLTAQHDWEAEQMTKTEAAQIVKRVLSYGYYDVGGGWLEISCPVCRKRVRAIQGMYTRPARTDEPANVDAHGNRVVYKRETVNRALKRELTEHLLYVDECTI
jgi:hypothetical protein